MSRDDLCASLFGAAYSAYMERPGLSRRIGRILWGGDTAPYYASMAAVGALSPGETVVGASFVRGVDTLRQRLLVRPNVGGFGAICTQVEIEMLFDSADFEAIATERSGPLLYFTARKADRRGLRSESA